MKRTLALILIIVLTVSLLAACGQSPSQAPAGQPASSAPAAAGEPAAELGPNAIVDEKITISVFHADAGNFTDLPTNKFVLWCEEQTNIHVDWIAPGEDPESKLTLILASGSDLPEVITGFEMSNGLQIQLGQEGILVPLNDYIDKFGTNVKAIYEKTGSRSMVTAPDGNIYGMPMLEESYQIQYPQKMWMNKVWLDALNLSMPTTTDEFYEVLKAFKTGDPNGNGIADEVPLAGTKIVLPGESSDAWNNSLDCFIMNSFVYYDNLTGRMVDNGKVLSSYVQPGWREGVRYLRKLYSEGLIDSESFTQNASQEMNLVENGDVVLLGAAPSGNPATFSAQDGDNIAQYVPVAPLKGSGGVQTTQYLPPELSNRAFITKACKNPEAAFRWIDFLLTEDATLRQIFGVLDYNWRYANPGEIGLNGKQANYTILKNLWVPEQNEGVELLPNIVESIAEGIAFEGMEDLGSGANLNDATDLYVPYKPKEYMPKVFMESDDTEFCGEFEGSVMTYATECFAKFVVGDMDIESDWDSYVGTINAMGLDKYLSILQKYYDMNK